jgi:hypothetical protein
LQFVHGCARKRRFAPSFITDYLFSFVSSHGAFSKVSGAAESDFVKPTGDGAFVANGMGLASQNQKGGLKGVLGIRVPFEDISANVEHQPTVAFHQNGKCGVIAPVDEAAHQVGVGEMLGVLRDQHVAQMPKDRIELSARHDLLDKRNRLPLHL